MTTLQIHHKGTITLPANLRKKYKLKEGQILTIIDLGEGAILLTPMISQVDKLADQIAKGFEKDNITFDDLLQALHKIRNTYT